MPCQAAAAPAPPAGPTWREEGTVKVMNWCALATAATMSRGPVSHPTCGAWGLRCVLDIFTPTHPCTLSICSVCKAN